jgi:very-short-patch-repair endonuclease
MRKTHEQYVSEMAIKRPDIEVNGKYIGSDKKILVKCKVCDHEWVVGQASSLLFKKGGCPNCNMKKKTKTHDQFEKELLEINDTIELLDKYVNKRTKLRVKCKICGHIWKPVANALSSGQGCPECHVNRLRKPREVFIKEVEAVRQDVTVIGEYVSISKAILTKCNKCNYEWSPIATNLIKGARCPNCEGRKKRSHEEFVEDMSEINPHVDIKGTFVNTASKIEYMCKVCDHSWSATADSLLRGTGCPNCAGTKRKTQEEFIQIMGTLHPNLSTKGNYVNSGTRIHATCNVCNYDWTPFAGSLMRGTGCPSCVGLARLTTEKFKQKIKIIHPHLRILGEYVTSKTPILTQCMDCKHKWEPTPNSLTSKKGGTLGKKCPMCTGYIKWSHELFVSNFKKVTTDIIAIGTYVDSRTKLRVKCKICGHEWDAKPSNLMQGTGCPKCARQYRFVGKNEAELFQPLIEELFPEVDFQYEFSPFFVDAYLEDYNLVIEYDEPDHECPGHKERDEERQKFIEDTYDVVFFRIKEKEFMDNPGPIIDELKFITEGWKEKL